MLMLPMVRTQIKWRMMVDRGGRCAFCDWCVSARGTQMHEIVSRSRTVGNTEARQLSFDKHICSLLCESCHTKIGHSVEANQTLLARNVTMYGRDNVKAAWDNLLDAMTLPPNIVFPEVTE